MKKNLRGKIREYIQSEEGKVGVKSPLTLGVAAGGLLLAHAMVTSSAQADVECLPSDPWECEDHEVCAIWCEGEWSIGTCIGVIHTQCIVPNH